MENDHATIIIDRPPPTCVVYLLEKVETENGPGIGINPFVAEPRAWDGLGLRKR